MWKMGTQKFVFHNLCYLYDFRLEIWELNFGKLKNAGGVLDTWGFVYIYICVFLLNHFACLENVEKWVPKNR